MTEAQVKIRQSVKDYLKLFPIEYEAFVKQADVKRGLQTTPFAETNEKSAIEQFLTEVPATLDTMIKTKLNDDEWQWYTSKEGTRWFGRTFRPFTIAKEI